MGKSREHPSHVKAERLFTQAEAAKKEGNLLAAQQLERWAANYEAEAARLAKNAEDQASLWRSAVAFAFHGGDARQLRALAEEALLSTQDTGSTLAIREMLNEAIEDETTTGMPVVRLGKLLKMRRELVLSNATTPTESVNEGSKESGS